MKQTSIAFLLCGVAVTGAALIAAHRALESRRPPVPAERAGGEAPRRPVKTRVKPGIRVAGPDVAGGALATGAAAEDSPPAAGAASPKPAPARPAATERGDGAPVAAATTPAPAAEAPGTPVRTAAPPAASPGPTLSPSPAPTGTAPTPTPYERPQGKIAQPLYITTGALPEALAGQRYSALMEATGGAPPYSWTVVSGRLPDSISLEGSGGVIEGVPASAGRSVFRVKVSDAEQQCDIAEHAIIVRGEGLAILTEALAEGEAGARYEQALEAYGGTPPYSWQAYPVSLPDGLALDPDRGVISGTPGNPEALALTLNVSDAGGGKASATFDLVIHASALAVATSTLPQGTRDAPYEAALEAAGGVPPYRWSLAGGELPAGLALDASSGLIGGTPSAAAGEYRVRVAVSDGEAARATRDLSLPVVEEERLAVTGLTAHPSDRKVALTWTNPARADYAYTVLVRSASSYPASPGDGVQVYRGTATDFLDLDLPNGAACHYAAIPYTDAGAQGTVTDGARASAVPQEVSLSGAADPYADEVSSFAPLSAGGYGSSSLSWALGAPRGAGAAAGSTHVVSLHARANTDDGASAPYGGSITLAFTDNVVVNGPGDDFRVFENTFCVGGDPARRWIEPAIVAVSKDGSTFHTFPCDFVPHYDAGGALNTYNPYCYVNADGSSRGFAGVTPVHAAGASPDPRTAAAGGDAFDLDDLPGAKLDWIRFVRLTATGDDWILDANGDRVRHTTDMGSCAGAGASGFDLDAVCAVHY